MFRSRTIAAAFLVLSLAGLPSAALAQACVSRAESRELLEQGQVVPLPEALQRAGLAGGRVVDAQLCQAGGGYVYRVRILQNGQVQATSIPAS